MPKTPSQLSRDTRIDTINSILDTLSPADADVYSSPDSKYKPIKKRRSLSSPLARNNKSPPPPESKELKVAGQVALEGDEDETFESCLGPPSRSSFFDTSPSMETRSSRGIEKQKVTAEASISSPPSKPKRRKSSVARVLLPAIPREEIISSTETIVTKVEPDTESEKIPVYEFDSAKYQKLAEE